MFVTIDEVKRFLNIGDMFDDDLIIGEFIEAAEAAIEKHIEQPVITFIEDGDLNPALKTAIKYLAAHFYMNREAVSYGQPYSVPLSYFYLLQPFKKYRKD